MKHPSLTPLLVLDVRGGRVGHGLHLCQLVVRGHGYILGCI